MSFFLWDSPSDTSDMEARVERKKGRGERAKKRAERLTKEKEEAEKLSNDPGLQKGYDPDKAVALVSWVGPGARQRCKQVAVNIHGFFHNIEEGKEYAEKLHKARPNVDLHWVKPGVYLVLPPPLSIADAIPMHYNDPKMNNIMSRYYNDQERNRVRVQERMKKAQKEARKRARAARKKRGLTTRRKAMTKEARTLAEETAAHPPTLAVLERRGSENDTHGHDGESQGVREIEEGSLRRDPI